MENILMYQFRSFLETNGFQRSHFSEDIRWELYADKADGSLIRFPATRYAICAEELAGHIKRKELINRFIMDQQFYRPGR